jgi:hypothetical protein
MPSLYTITVSSVAANSSITASFIWDASDFVATPKWTARPPHLHWQVRGRPHCTRTWRWQRSSRATYPAEEQERRWWRSWEVVVEEEQGSSRHFCGNMWRARRGRASRPGSAS